MLRRWSRIFSCCNVRIIIWAIFQWIPHSSHTFSLSRISHAIAMIRISRLTARRATSIHSQRFSSLEKHWPFTRHCALPIYIYVHSQVQRPSVGTTARSFFGLEMKSTWAVFKRFFQSQRATTSSCSSLIQQLSIALLVLLMKMRISHPHRYTVVSRKISPVVSFELLKSSRRASTSSIPMERLTFCAFLISSTLRRIAQLINSCPTVSVLNLKIILDPHLKETHLRGIHANAIHLINLSIDWARASDQTLRETLSNE